MPNAEAANKVMSFLNDDLNKIDALIERYPLRIPIPAVADFFSMDENSVRAAVEGGAFGFAWRKSGKANKAYCVPTAQFVRWYLNVGVLEGANRGAV
ncbi:MAG: hypothetical protein NC395_07320 [Prevotella sp.]|nr:hypothetical protein [Prevotella sp.]